MKHKRNARERLIVALDCPTQAMGLNLVHTLGDEVLFYKVGWRLFLQGGMDLVTDLRNLGKDVFLDLKMDDIEETIETAIQTIGAEVMFLTIQGNSATARAAVRGRGDRSYPKLLFVTLLSSLDEKDLAGMYSVPSEHEGLSLLDSYVTRRADQALKAGSDGLIASGQTITMLRQRFGPEPIIVCPGIRPPGSSVDDHKRSLTPKQAILNGADYLVVGRPIRLATDPVAATRAIISDMDEALSELQAS